MKKIQYRLLSCALIISLSAMSQAPVLKELKLKRTELSINAFCGLSGFSGSLVNGTVTPEVGTMYCLEGSLFLSSSLGVGMGVGYANYTTSVKLNNYVSSVETTDDGGDKMKYNVKASNISEKEKVSAFEIPLFMAYRSSSTKVYFEGNAGVKVSIPVTSSYNYTGGTITTTGYYEKYNIELADMPEHGYQTVNNPAYSGKLSTNTVFSVFAKVGCVIPTGTLGIHISLYGSYGLNSILKSQSYILASYPNMNYPVTSLWSKLTLISGGIKVGVIL
jgi:hypothetical protein